MWPVDTRHMSCHDLGMIKSFSNPGLKALHSTGDASGVNPQHVKRLTAILAQLDIAGSPKSIQGPPGWRLHRWRDSDIWSIDVSGPWRVLFKFLGKDVIEVDYAQPH